VAVPDVHPLTEVRTSLPTILRSFRDRGPAAMPIVFGRFAKPEGVLLPWVVFERLVDAAFAAEELVHAAEWSRRLRHPAGPAATGPGEIAALLGVGAVALPTTRRGPSTSGYALRQWPSFADDVLRLERAPADTRQALADSIAALSLGHLRTRPAAVAEDRPELSDLQRSVVSSDVDGVPLAITMTAPRSLEATGSDGGSGADDDRPVVDLIACTPLGGLTKFLPPARSGA